MAKTWRRRLLHGALWGVMALGVITLFDYLRFPDARGLQSSTWVSIDGQVFDLADTDQPVLLYFWGDWCVFCRHTSPQVQALYRAGYPVITVASYSGDAAAVRAYVQKQGWDFPVVNDPDGAIWQAFALAAVPTVAFVEDGKIRLSTSGFSSAWGLRVRYFLLTLLPS